jgi:hypothetical protein
MLFVICMETKTTLPEFFKFIETLPILIKMENLLLAYWKLKKAVEWIGDLSTAYCRCHCSAKTNRRRPHLPAIGQPQSWFWGPNKSHSDELWTSILPKYMCHNPTWRSSLKVMSRTIAPSNPDVRAYLARPFSEGKIYKGKRTDLKCQHCHNIEHTIDRC